MLQGADLLKFGVAVEDVFAEGDEDGSGELSFAEFSRCFFKLGIPAGISIEPAAAEKDAED